MGLPACSKSTPSRGGLRSFPRSACGAGVRDHLRAHGDCTAEGLVGFPLLFARLITAYGNLPLAGQRILLDQFEELASFFYLEIASRHVDGYKTSIALPRGSSLQIRRPNSPPNILSSRPSEPSIRMKTLPCQKRN